MIEVSVIIPTFNRRETLPRAVKSVLKQEGVAFEVLVIDDGSTDGTQAMLEADFPSVSCYYQDNRGPSAARNLGLQKAKGAWIAFLDSDDEWLPGKLQAQLNYLAQNPELQICQTEEIWIRNGRRVNAMKKHQKYGGWIFDKCLPLCIISPSAVMIHRSLFEEVDLFDESLLACEDYDLWLRIAARFPVGLIEKPFVTKYGGHEDQQSRKFEVMDRFRIYALEKILKLGMLNAEQTVQAQQMLDEKTKIVTQGAEKRGRKTAALPGIYETL